MDIIYPATDKHILKYTSQPMYFVHETEEMYQTVTLHHILDNGLSLQVSVLSLNLLENIINFILTFKFSGYTIA